MFSQMLLGGRQGKLFRLWFTDRTEISTERVRARYEECPMGSARAEWRRDCSSPTGRPEKRAAEEEGSSMKEFQKLIARVDKDHWILLSQSLGGDDIALVVSGLDLHQILVGLPGSRTALLGSGGIWRPDKTSDSAPSDQQAASRSNSREPGPNVNMCIRR
jgi:hypothetical protein